MVVRMTTDHLSDAACCGIQYNKSFQYIYYYYDFKK